MEPSGWWLAIFLAAPVWWVARRVVPVLVSRYDSVVLRVEPPAAVAVGLQNASVTQERCGVVELTAWCLASTDTRAGHFWRPGAATMHDEIPLAVAVWRGGHLAVAAQQIEDFSRHLDGSDRLTAARGALGGLVLRIQVKCQDAMWWRARQPGDPWDCGYWVCEPAVQQALHRFRPRRATLMVAHAWPADALAKALETLSTQSAGFQHPVRVLVTGDDTLEAWRPPSGVPVLVIGGQAPDGALA